MAQCRVGPNLAQSTLNFIHDMISSGELAMSRMAEAAGCSKRTVTRSCPNLRMYGSIKAPLIKKVMWMNRDMINILALEEQHGPL